MTSARARATRCCWPPLSSGAGRFCQPGKVHQVEHVRHALAYLGAPHVTRCKRERDVLFHGHVRPDGVRLEDHAEIALVRRQSEALAGHNDLTVAEVDVTLVGHFESGDHAERRRLSASGRAEERVDLPVFNVERELVHCRDLSARIGLAQPIELHRCVPFSCCCRHRPLPRIGLWTTAVRSLFVSPPEADKYTARLYRKVCVHATLMRCERQEYPYRPSISVGSS